MKKTGLILIVVLLIPAILLSMGVVNRGCGVDRTYALAEDLKERTGQDFDYNEWEYEDLQAMEKEIDKEEKESGKIVWTKEEIDELKEKVLKSDEDIGEVEETEVADNADEQTTEAVSEEDQQAEFLTPIRYKVTSLDIKSVYEPREGDPQMDEYDDILFGGQWDIDTSDLSKCEIVIAPVIMEDPSNPGELIMTSYYAEVSLSGPARDYDMDTSSTLARSAEASQWTNTEGLNKYEYLEMIDSEINGRFIGELHGAGQGDEEKHLAILWRDFSTKYDNDSISGTITCFWGRVSPEAFVVTEDSMTTVITFTGEIVK